MTLPTTNVSFSAIQTEFGGSNPISLSEYYRGGTYVKTNTTMPNGTIAASGAISISTFRGATQGVIAPTYSLTRSVGSVNEGGSFTISFSTNQAGSFGYTISGVSSADIGGASLTGTVSNGSVLSYSVTADSTTENTETFIIQLNNGQASTSVTINDTSVYPAYGTIISQGCVAYGSAPYTYRVTKADGAGGTFNEDTNNSPSCGYVAPVPPSSATWSVGFSNNGTAGPISVFVLVTLNRAATVTTTYTFSGVVVQNGVTFSVPTVTIPVGSTSANPSSFSGVTNGSGPYSTITLRVTPVTVPYPLTPSGFIDTPFQYSA
jgi:hypothetical protein